MLPEPLAITLLVIEAFEKVNIPYLIGGSLASALHGKARSTLDTDLVADLQPEQVNSLVEQLQKDFYIDREMILDAIKHQSSFNVIYLSTTFKVDVFIAKTRRFDRMHHLYSYDKRSRTVNWTVLRAGSRLTRADKISTNPNQISRSSLTFPLLANLRARRAGQAPVGKGPRPGRSMR